MSQPEWVTRPATPLALWLMGRTTVAHQPLDSGFRAPGSWILDSGSWIPDSPFRDPGFRSPQSRIWIPDPGCRTPHPRILDSGFWIPASPVRNPHSGIPDFPSRDPVFRFWRFAVLRVQIYARKCARLPLRAQFYPLATKTPRRSAAPQARHICDSH